MINNDLSFKLREDLSTFVVGEFEADDDEASVNWLNAFIGSGYLPLITKPTRITHSSATLIDNIYTNLRPNIGLTSGILEIDMSDHLPVFLFSYTKKNDRPKQPKTFTYRNLNSDAYENMRNKLDSIEWTTLHNMGMEEGYSTFMDLLKNTINRVSPQKTAVIPTHKIIREPWITRGIMKSSYTLDKLYKKKLKHPPEHITHMKYKEYRNKFNMTKRICKQLYYGEILTEYKNNTKELWKHLRPIIGKTKNKTIICNEFFIDGKKEDNETKIANNFCEYFTNVEKNFPTKFLVPQRITKNTF